MRAHGRLHPRETSSRVELDTDGLQPSFAYPVTRPWAGRFPPAQCTWKGSNLRPSPCRGDALPLSHRCPTASAGAVCAGGRCRIRTCSARGNGVTARPSSPTLAIALVPVRRVRRATASAALRRRGSITRAARARSTPCPAVPWCCWAGTAPTAGACLPPAVCGRPWPGCTPRSSRRGSPRCSCRRASVA